MRGISLRYILCILISECEARDMLILCMSAPRCQRDRCPIAGNALASEMCSPNERVGPVGAYAIIDIACAIAGRAA